MKAILEEKGIDFETSGLKYLPNEARVRTSCSLRKSCTPCGVQAMLLLHVYSLLT